MKNIFKEPDKEPMNSCVGQPWRGLRKVPQQERGAYRTSLYKGLHFALVQGRGAPTQNALHIGTSTGKGFVI